MYGVAVIGIGNLGMRHLESLCYLPDFNLYGVEINPNRANIMRDHFSGKVKIFDSIDALPSKNDVVIIATNSDVRSAVFFELVSKKKVDNIIFEKVLFQKKDDYYLVAKTLKEKNISAWVNCARREWKSYQVLKNELDSCRELYVSVVGGEWGLGCNIIHMLDLIQFLSGEPIEDINISKLIDKIIESKRRGFCEFFGTFTGSGGRCKDYRITCLENSSLPLHIDIYTEDARYSIKEGKRIQYALKKTEWNEECRAFEAPFQSQLTGNVVLSVIKNGRCNLPKYEESMDLHLKLINELNNFFNKNGVEGDLCPIS